MLIVMLLMIEKTEATTGDSHQEQTSNINNGEFTYADSYVRLISEASYVLILLTSPREIIEKTTCVRGLVLSL